MAKVIQKTSLIIWDEAPMMHKNAFDVVDRTLRDILSASDNTGKSKIFGGLTVALGGDFRQILHVVKRGKREDIVAASLKISEINLEKL